MIIKIDPKNPSHRDIMKASEIIKKGGTVIFPTETLYGLGGIITDEKVIKRIFKIKSRSSVKPLPVMISNLENLHLVAYEIPKEGEILAKKYWPGPLTLILKKSPSISSVITCGGPSAGIRIPANPVALKLLEAVGVPMAVTSANISGEENILTIEEIIDCFKNEVDVIIDGGPISYGIASTVVDLTGEKPVILREGKIQKEEIFKEVNL